MDVERQEKPHLHALRSIRFPRAMSNRSVCLGLLFFLSAGCDLIGSRPMTPAHDAALVTSGAGFSARVEKIHVDYITPKPNHRVDVYIENGLDHEVHIEPEKIELAVLGPTSADSKGQKTELSGSLSIDPAIPVEGAIAGAKAGSSLGSGTGSSGAGASVVGAGLGVAGALVVMLPLFAIAAIDAAIVNGSKDLQPGEAGIYRIVLPKMSIEDGKPYGLMLDGALGLSRGTVAPLPLIRPELPHFGYLPPGEAEWVFSGRMGGGAIRRAPYTAGLGGLEIFIGKQFGRMSVGGFGTIGAGAWGGEMRLRFQPARILTIVPFFGYGYYPIVGYLGFNAGHGPRWGTELLFSSGDTLRFGHPRNSTKFGIYAAGGPVFLRVVEGVGFAGQVGLCFGVF